MSETELKLPTSKHECDCKLCKASREIRRLRTLLPEPDANELDALWDWAFEEMAEQEMNIASNEEWRQMDEQACIASMQQAAKRFLDKHPITPESH